MMDIMKFAIWGCGTRGKMLAECIDKKRIQIFVDGNEKLIGTSYEGIPIVSFEDYLSSFYDCFIIVSSVLHADAMMQLLKENHINHFFDLGRCPMELPSYNDKLPFSEMLSSIPPLKKTQTVVLAGLTLFAVLFYEYLLENGYENVYLLSIKKEHFLEEEIKVKFPKYKFIGMNQIHGDMRVLIMDRHVDATNDWNQGIVDRFYRFTFLSRHRQSNMSCFKKIHAGERCFIVGNGPSLKAEDLECIYSHKEISFGVNHIYKSFPLTSWRPSYYCWSATSITQEIINTVKRLDIKHKFIGNRNPLVSDDIAENIYCYPSLYEYFEEEGPDFSEELNQGIFAGHTVLYDCLQLAVYMGFKRIYIIGADCEFPQGRVHFYEEKEEGIFNLTDKIFIAFRKAREYAESHDIEICNATRGGKLEVFPRVECDSLFACPKFGAIYR